MLYNSSMGRKTPDLTGQRFGRLQVLSRIPREKGAPGQARWLCWCDCGTMTSVGSNAMRSGNTQSCGCLHRETVAARHAIRRRDVPPPAAPKIPIPETIPANSALTVRRTRKPRDSSADPTTWRSKSPSYGSWYNMVDRCTNPDNPRYSDWGGRGITVCKRWLSFDNFLADMGERPPGMSIDRKNNDGDYDPNNCEWATPHQQLVNSRLFKLTPEVVDEIKRLRATGLSLRAIGIRLELNRKTVSRALSGKGRSRKKA